MTFPFYKLYLNGHLTSVVAAFMLTSLPRGTGQSGESFYFLTELKVRSQENG